MDLYLDRPLALGQKIPQGGADGVLPLQPHTYHVGNPVRTGASYPVRVKAAVYCSTTDVLNLVAEVQPYSKAEDLGYVFRLQGGSRPGEPDRIQAFEGPHPVQPPVGELSYTAMGAYLQDLDVQVDEAHRRRGIATALYQQAEALSSKAFLSRAGEVLPIDAAALWASPDRPFGVDALYSQPYRLLWVNQADLLPAALKALPPVHFDPQVFASSPHGQQCIAMARDGLGLRTGLQEARVRGLMPHGQHGLFQDFVADPHAPLRCLRGVHCGQAPAQLALSNGKGLPDTSISPLMGELRSDARLAVQAFLTAHLPTLADLDVLDGLHPLVRGLARARQPGRPLDTRGLVQALVARRTRTLSMLNALLEPDVAEGTWRPAACQP